MLLVLSLSGFFCLVSSVSVTLNSTQDFHAELVRYESVTDILRVLLEPGAYQWTQSLDILNMQASTIAFHGLSSETTVIHSDVQFIHVRVSSANPTTVSFSNITLSGCRTIANGGTGCVVVDGSNTLIFNNVTLRGASVYGPTAQQSAPLLVKSRNALFIGNHVRFEDTRGEHLSADGGAVLNRGGFNCSSCVFSNNTAIDNGGALASFFSEAPPFVYLDHFTLMGTSSENGAALFRLGTTLRETETSLTTGIFSSGSSRVGSGAAIFSNNVLLHGLQFYDVNAKYPIDESEFSFYNAVLEFSVDVPVRRFLVEDIIISDCDMHGITLRANSPVTLDMHNVSVVRGGNMCNSVTWVCGFGTALHIQSNITFSCHGCSFIDNSYPTIAVEGSSQLVLTDSVIHALPGESCLVTRGTQRIPLIFRGTVDLNCTHLGARALVDASLMVHLDLPETNGLEVLGPLRIGRHATFFPIVELSVEYAPVQVGGTAKFSGRLILSNMIDGDVQLFTYESSSGTFAFIDSPGCVLLGSSYSSRALSVSCITQLTPGVTVTGEVVIVSPLTVDAGVNVAGNLVLGTSSNITFAETVAPINVTGSIVLNGTLVVVLNSLPAPGGSLDVVVLEGDSFSGSFADVSLETSAELSSCQFLIPQSAVVGTQLIVTVSSVSRCGLSPGVIAGIAAGSVVLAIIVIVLLHRLLILRKRQFDDEENARIRQAQLSDMKADLRQPQ